MADFTETKKPVAIRISGIKKEYRLGTIGGRTLQSELQSWWAKKRGKEDPNVRIGMDQRLIGQRFMALNGIDLTIYQGERIGIIGANGAGKSTLLKLLSRITAPTEGEIDLYGRVSSMLEVGTGFHGELTGRENIYMNGAILGMSRSEIDARMDEIIDFSEVRDFIDTPVKRYSSGMFVKLAFSVAAHLNSEIMIMDEVLAVGDMAFQRKCLEKMRKTADEEGRTILYVSHNMETIRRLCERCVVLDQGKIIFDGDVEQAIAVYMDRSLSQNEVDMDLTAATHNVPGERLGLYMQHLFLEGKMTASFEEGESMHLRLRLQTDRPFHDILFRMSLRTDTDLGLGTVWSKQVSFDRVGAYEVTFEVPLSLLAKGIFYASIGIGEVLELGRVRMLDYITNAFRFEVRGVPVWSVPAYGFVRFPELAIQTKWLGEKADR